METKKMERKVKRKYEGDYPTPINVAEKAIEFVDKVLGKEWREQYAVWDMTCGKGNLETKLMDKENMFLSTLKESDIQYMNENKFFEKAKKFQYDYLNDDVALIKGLSYTSGKLPQELMKYIENKGEGLFVLINPPYAESSAIMDKVKKGVTKTNYAFKLDGMGRAINEIYAQILYRINEELPKAKIGLFSTLKYITGDSFKYFRKIWTRKSLGGFIVNSERFEGVSKGFPISFIVWDEMGTEPEGIDDKKITVDIYNKRLKKKGEKVYSACNKEQYLKKLLSERYNSKNNMELEDTVPLCNALTIQKNVKNRKNGKTKKMVGSLGYFTCGGNDRYASYLMTNILSTVNGRGHGFFITKDNLETVTKVFCIRKSEKINWTNNKLQFVQPNKEFSEEETNDLMIWMLFNCMNLSVTANMYYEKKEYNIRNNFIIYNKEMIEEKNKGYEEILKDKGYKGYKEFRGNEFSDEEDKGELVYHIGWKIAKAVIEGKVSEEGKKLLEEGLRLWRAFYECNVNEEKSSIIEKYKLEDNDRYGYYQIKHVMEIREKEQRTDFRMIYIEKAYKELTKRVRKIVEQKYI